MAVTFTGGVQVPAMLGNNALTQHLFSIENGIGSRVDVDVRKIRYQMDAIAVLTSVTSQVKATRATGISGGVVLDGTYKAYMVVIADMVPSSSGSSLYFRTSTNAGSSYDSGASDYSWGFITNTTATYTSDAADSQISLYNTAVDNGEFVNGFVHIFTPNSTHKFAVSSNINTFRASTAPVLSFSGVGARLSAADVDAIRFLMSSGDISSGTFTLYGLKGA